MEIVNFLAQLWGFSLAIISLFFLINQRYIKEISQMMKSQTTLVLSGMIYLVLGIILILTYNSWEASWTMIITILGWAVFIKGLIRMFFPNFVIKIWNKLENKKDWLSFLLLFFVFLGCFLIYAGIVF